MKLLFATLAAAIALPAFAQVPPIKECIAPADAGGGWDFTCRNVSKFLTEEGIVPNSIQTLNIGGAGGGLAFANVVSKRNDDNGVFIAASTATATKLGRGEYPGMTADMVRWVGTIGADYGVVAVAKSSPYHTLPELLAAVKEKPSAIKFTGGDAGWDQLKILQAAKLAGVTNIRAIGYLPYDSGAKALSEVIGGHIGAFSGDISEIRGYLDSPDLRILAVFSATRLPPPYDAIPTAKEQGIDFVGANWRGFYLPKNVSNATYDWWVATLQSLAKNSKWQAVMNANGLVPFDKYGADFTQYVDAQIKSIHEITAEMRGN